MNRQTLLRGALLGAAVGLLNAAVTTLYFTAVAQHIIEIPIDPADLLTPTLWLPAVGLGLVVGGLGAAVHRRQEPAWTLHLVVASFALLVLATRMTQWRMLLVELVITLGLAMLVRRAGRRAPLAALAVAALWAGGMVALHRPTPPAPASGPAARGPNVLLVVLDTVRADHLSTWGYARPTSPVLDGLSRRGTLFERAFAPASWTAPSHASMFTGLYPSWHGCHEEHRVLLPEQRTLAEILGQHGYETVLYTGNPWLGAHSGLSQGFSAVTPSWRLALLAEHYPAAWALLSLVTGDLDKGAGVSNDGFRAWLAGRDPARPFFATVNYLEAHTPYARVPRADRDRFLPDTITSAQARAASDQLQTWLHLDVDYDPDADREVLTALYDGGIHNADRRLGELIESLEQAGQLDDTLVIITADHGEMFGEHRAWGHQITLHEGTVGVPLLVLWPGGEHAGRHVLAPASLVDIFPTVLRATGVTSDVQPHGVALQTLLEPAPPDRVLFAWQGHPEPNAARRVAHMGANADTWGQWVAQQAHLRLIRQRDGSEQAWRTGVGVEQPIPLDDPQVAALRAALEQHIAQAPAAQGEEPEMDEGTRRELEALGYLGSE